MSSLSLLTDKVLKDRIREQRRRRRLREEQIWRTEGVKIHDYGPGFTMEESWTLSRTFASVKTVFSDLDGQLTTIRHQLGRLGQSSTSESHSHLDLPRTNTTPTPLCRSSGTNVWTTHGTANLPSSLSESGSNQHHLRRRRAGISLQGSGALVPLRAAPPPPSPLSSSMCMPVHVDSDSGVELNMGVHSVLARVDANAGGDGNRDSPRSGGSGYESDGSNDSDDEETPRASPVGSSCSSPVGCRRSCSDKERGEKEQSSETASLWGWF